MIWRKYLNKVVHELIEYLEKDIQYSGMPRGHIRQIAWREIESFIKKFKNWSPEKLVLKENAKIDHFDKVSLINFLKKRQRGVPLAYITGQQEFCGLNFKVDKNTLIPRPETEELVEKALNLISERFLPNKRPWVLIDFGTGSGCVVVSVVRNLAAFGAKYRVFAVDNSAKALKMAKINAKKLLGNSSGINFIRSANLEFLDSLKLSPYVSIFIIANLPYLSQKEYKNVSPEVKKEPKNALIGGRQGSELIIQLLDQLKKFNNPIEILLEISPTIYPRLKKYCASNIKISRFSFSRDLSKKIRIFYLKTKSNNLSIAHSKPCSYCRKY